MRPPALRRDFPPALPTLLSRPARPGLAPTYGMLDGRFDGRALLDYVAPGA
jgi:hypothetical protein